MKPPQLYLDYIEPAPQPLWTGVLLLAVALGIAASLALRLREARVELSHRAASQELLNTGRAAAKRAPNTRLAAEAMAAESVVRQLTLPWALLIETLEAASIKDVAILQIQPDAQQQLLRITGEARNHQAMLAYLDGLSATGTLRDVHLVNHQKQQDDPQKPVQFAVHATFHTSLKAAP